MTQLFGCLGEFYSSPSYLNRDKSCCVHCLLENQRECRCRSGCDKCIIKMYISSLLLCCVTQQNGTKAIFTRPNVFSMKFVMSLIWFLTTINHFRVIWACEIFSSFIILYLSDLHVLFPASISRIFFFVPSNMYSMWQLVSITRIALTYLYIIVVISQKWNLVVGCLG